MVMISRRRFLFAASLAAPWLRTWGAGAHDMGGAPMPSRMMKTTAALPTGVGPPLHLEALARFVDPLPIPSVLRPKGLRPDPHDPSKSVLFYRIPMREMRARVHRDVPPTTWWTYGGSVPGPTIETRSGRGVLIEWRNELPSRHFLPIDHSLCGAEADQPEVRAIAHVHGARVPAASDGYPTDWLTPGRSVVFHYPNRQDAALLWYHDHAMGIERLNHWAGMFGLFVIRDEVEDALHLPRGRFEVPLVICDRFFGADGQLHYPTSGSPESPWVPEVYGDALLVNQTLFPYLDVEPRLYRFRVVNASNGRPYYLSLSNQQSFHQIGTDQGLLPAPVGLDKITLAPAERADLLVDFSRAAGQKLVLRSQAFELMQFRVSSGPARKPQPLPARLRAVPRIDPSSVVTTRTLTLNGYEDPTSHRMLMLLDGKRWHEPVTEKAKLGSVEIWRLVNLTEDAHPIHLHLVRFQILDRQPFDADEFLTSGKLIVRSPVPPGPDEAGWKDTVRAEPGMITRIIIRFEGYVGRYVWHCHLLEHAANEMMRPLEIVSPSSEI
jgi:spore coat protein A